jgi:hypothetical protein
VVVFINFLRRNFSSKNAAEKATGVGHDCT